MSEIDDYIEDYFEDRLDAGARRSFETRCTDDEPFAKEVAFYLTRRKLLREELLRQKQAAWTDGQGKESHPLQRKSSHPIPVRKLIPRKWIAYAAAACTLIVVILYLNEKRPTTQRLAENYTEKKYSLLSQTMDGSTDSLQQAIAAYNNKDNDKALTLFETLYRSHPENKDALLYSGIVYLRTKNYDKALGRFQELADTRNLMSNPGTFLEAVTLLQRDAAGDQKMAKELLNKVVQQQLDGRDEAAAWLKEL
jgi:tetratricopeptide (TPR) repeat protein